jgi:hypothetical protein
MKKLIVLIAILFLTSCGLTQKEKEEKSNQNAQQYKMELPDQRNDKGYKIIVLDSCEYIYAWFGEGNGGGSLTHKGNCKFCKQRRMKEISDEYKIIK